MQTKKLYYEDCHLRQFEGAVTDCQPAGDQWAVILDQTAFYPEGGGQACDLGTLGNAEVLDVQESGEQVVHYCSQPFSVGQRVCGEINWQRRFDLMQQHTGEHLLSGIIHKKYGYHNSGFHVGTGLMEVDFDGPIPQEDIRELEYQCNQLVWQNLPVLCTYPSAEELPAIPYRTKRELPWPVRIVDIPGADTCACCGVHVGHTGEVGLILILSCVKFHSGVRLEMVCGERAVRYMQRIFLENRRISQGLSAKMTETADAVQKLQDAYNGEKFRAAGLEKKLFDAVAEGYRGQENVLHFAENLSGSGVRDLCDRIAAVCSGYAITFSGSDELGYQVCIVSRRVSVRELGARLVQALNGRGGGKDFAFQGSIKATRAEITQFLSNL